MIFRNLWYRRARTLLTVLGIAVGVAAVVAFSAFGEGFANGFERAFSSASANLTVAQPDAVTVVTSALDESIGDELAQIPGVEQVVGTVLGVLQMPDSPYFVVKGEEPRGFALPYYRLIAGQALSGRRQIMLGRLAAEASRKAVGQTLALNGVTYRIVGIYETGAGLEDGGAVLALDDAQRAFDRPRQVSFLAIAVKEPARAGEIARQLEGQFPQIVVSRASALTQRMQDFKTLGALIGIRIVLAVVVGGIVMMNAMLMSVFERTQEIGVLRALGWRRLRVLRLVVAESLALSLLSVLAGAAFGVGLCALVRLEPNYGRFFVTPAYTPRLFGQVLALALALGGLGGLYPAWRASGLSPIEALRYE